MGVDHAIMDSDDDWDADDFEIPTFGANAPVASSAKTFDDEEEEDDEPVVRRKPQKPAVSSKKAVSKYDESRGVQDIDDTPLDDPVAEKLRKQKLLEDADLQNAEDLFGTGPSAKKEATKELKTLSDFKNYGDQLVFKHVKAYKENKHFAAMIKAFLRSALKESPSKLVKEIETSVVTLRNERVKAEKEANKLKNKPQKKQINVGASGGDASLDDAGYGALDDDYDFM